MIKTSTHNSMYFSLTGIDVNGPIFTGLRKNFKNIEAIKIHGKGFQGHTTNETFSDLHDYENIQKMIIYKTNIKTVDKESLHRFKDLKGKINYKTQIFIYTYIFICSKHINYIFSLSHFALSEIAIENNFLLHNLPSDLFSTLEKVNRMRISMNNKLHTLPSNVFDSLTQLKGLKLSGTSRTKLRLPSGLLDR